ncbi:MAG: hypothetical protein LBU32_33250 [Clostridiales bacterium]|nr:hypothetical protein [Clostridiales bacterium]
MQKVVVFLDYANASKAARDSSVRINHEHPLKNYLALNEEGRSCGPPTPTLRLIREKSARPTH